MSGYEMEEMWAAMKDGHYKRAIDEIKLDVEEAENISEAITSSLHTIVIATHSAAGTFWYWDRFYDNLIYPRATYGGTPLVGISIKPGQGVAGKVIQDGQSIIVYDCMADANFNKNVDKKTGFITKTMMCVPIKIHDVCFGCLQIINRTDDLLFDDKDLAFAEDLANVITNLMYERGMLNDFLHFEAITESDENGKAVFTDNSFNTLVSTVKQSFNYIELSYDVQQEVLKHLMEIKIKLKV